MTGETMSRSTECDLATRWIRAFWNQVDRSNECWLWTGAKDQDGYGVANFGKIWKAHRLAWFLCNGGDLCPEDFVCHHCDNPSCVNPTHLFVGDHTTNMQDSASKFRRWQQFSEHKFNEVVRLGKDGKTHTEISDLTGVSTSAISEMLIKAGLRRVSRKDKEEIIQAIENRPEGQTLKECAKSLGISYAKLHCALTKARRTGRTNV